MMRTSSTADTWQLSKDQDWRVGNLCVTIGRRILLIWINFAAKVCCSLTGSAAELGAHNAVFIPPARFFFCLDLGRQGIGPGGL